MGNGLENHGGATGEADQTLKDVLKIWVLTTAGIPSSSPWVPVPFGQLT